MNYVIGCGGVGSWLVPKLAKLTDRITLIDGDKLERGNLDRQLFDPICIGRMKADAIAERHGLAGIPEYFHSALDLGITSEDLLFCCADNHACRREVLQTCDELDCRCIIAANEYTDAEAYWYERSMRGTPNDPRNFYPNILTDHSGDPLGPPGCQGDAQAASPQLVLANDMASSFAGWLYWFHTQERPKLDVNDKQHFPIMHKASIYRFQTTKWGDRT